MELMKRLVILTGKTGRGTALIERNGMGTFITVNAFSLPDLTAGEYALGVKTADKIFRRELGSLGRIKARFALDGDVSDAVHLVLFCTQDDEVVLYGTTESRKMWESNLMDGLRGERVEKTLANSASAAAIAPPSEFTYSERKVEDYFLSIDPSQYRDNAVAQENYYRYVRSPFADDKQQPSEQERAAEEVTDEEAAATVAAVLSDEQDEPQQDQSPKDATQECAAAADAATERREEMPGELERMYLRRRFSHQDVSAAAGQAVPPPETSVKKASQYTVEQAVAAVKTGAAFYATVKDKLDDLFARGEKFAPLEQAMPGTRWVKVDYDASGRYYVVGLIGTAPDYIAYGVPGRYGATPPPLDGADFVPLSQGGSAEGFWVLFQSAQTGEEILRP